MHGPHHVAQKSTTTTRPLRSASDLILSSVAHSKVIAGAA